VAGPSGAVRNMGTPSFRVVCEKAAQNVEPSRFVGSRFPPLQKTQRWGTLFLGGIGNRRLGTRLGHDLWMAFFRDTEGNLMGLMSEVKR
jgi:hypothetical protein